FQRLSTLGSLPKGLAAATEICLAECFMRGRKFRRASHHLRTALCYRPKNANAHWLLGQALSKGREPDIGSALQHYRRALALKPGQAKCRSEYGLLLVRIGWCERGLSQLRKAAKLAPDDSEVLDQVVRGLCIAGQTHEARSLLLAARFRRRRDSCIQSLWNAFQFRQLRNAQQAVLRQKEASIEHQKGPVTLPFASLPD